MPLWVCRCIWIYFTYIRLNMDEILKQKTLKIFESLRSYLHLFISFKTLNPFIYSLDPSFNWSFSLTSSLDRFCGIYGMINGKILMVHLLWILHHQWILFHIFLHLFTWLPSSTSSVERSMDSMIMYHESLEDWFGNCVLMLIYFYIDYIFIISHTYILDIMFFIINCC